MDFPITYEEYKIVSTSDGFSMPVLFGQQHGSLYQILTFIVTKGSEAYPFLFAINTVEASIHGFDVSGKDKEQAIERAVDATKQRLSEGGLVDRREYLFELNLEGSEVSYSPVTNPVWKSPDYR